MTLTELFEELNRHGVHLSAKGEELTIRAPKGALSPPLLASLSEKKPEILARLRQASLHPQTQASIFPKPQDRYLPFPLTDIQQAYWLGRTPAIDLGRVACQFYFEMESADLDIERLSRAWQRLIDRHDMLRAIVEPDGQQRILARVPAYDIEVLDLTDREASETAQELEQIRREMSHRVAPAEQWPLFEIRATRLKQILRVHFRIELILADAWSVGLLLEEWFQHYLDPGLALPPLELSFRDYVLAEAAGQSSDAYKRAEKYWLDRLPTLPPGPDLPLAQSPASIKQPRFVRRSAELDRERWQKLKARAARAGLTPSGVLCAAFAEVLATWSKSPEFLLNLTFFNRPPLHSDVNKVVGDFTATILLQVRGVGDTFEARAQCLQEQLRKDLDYSQYNGVRVLREQHRLRGGAIAATAPVVFTSGLSIRAGDESPMGSPLELIFGISQTPQVWLDHQTFERAGKLLTSWDAVDALFPPGLLDDMFGAYARLIGLLADEEAIWREPAITCVPPEQLRQREAINATGAPISGELLHTLFARQASEDPSRTAVIAGDRSLTYDDLLRRSNALGRQLREAGARPNTLIAVVLEKGWEQAVAVLGILVSGAAYLPIDPDLPLERIQYLLENGEVEMLVTSGGIDARLSWPMPVRRFYADEEELALGDPSPLEPVCGPQDLAYVIYTSGSTGFPKGVMIDHRGAVNTVLDVNSRFGVGPEDRVLALSALSFDLSVYDIFGTLAAGGAIVFPDPSGLRDPQHWVELMNRRQVTIWNSVPALLQILVEYAAGRTDVLPRSLRLVLLSGDWIPVTLPGQMQALLPELQIISMGGATEASIWSILYPVKEVDPAWRSIPYGRPMVNQRFHVLNRALEPRPVWVPGELYIGGIGLAQGYWRDPEKTCASFFEHPRTQERLYRTGDHGRYLPDGGIEFLGREDFQVKIGGHRIELAEIEAALLQHPRVRAAAAVAAGDPKGKRRLVAYVVAAEAVAAASGQPAPNSESSTGTAPAAETSLVAELRTFLKTKLAEYMVPSAFVFLEALPLTANGKADRKALLALGTQSAQSSSTYVAPCNDLERRLASAVQETLRLERVGVFDSFFDLGANSVELVQMHRHLRSFLDRELPIVDLFRNPTISALAEFMSRSDGAMPGRTAAADLDLSQDAILDPAIFAHVPAEPVLPPAFVFLTGATGFLGGYLLRELVQQSEAQIYCLVRAQGLEEAQARLTSKLDSLGMSGSASRVKPVVGDLRKPQFGLSAEQYEKLAGRIDTIYHAGADVNFVRNYEDLKPGMVAGTTEVLRFAAQSKTKPVHHVSSLAVFGSPAYLLREKIYEDDPLADSRGLPIGYAQSKWVTERLMMEARSRGIPTAVYRPGFIAGDSRTGDCKTNDLLPLFIRGSVELGLAPEMSMHLEIMPVDEVSRAIVKLSLRADSLGKAFNLAAPRSVSWGQAFEGAARSGYPIECVPYGEWLKALRDAPPDNPLLPLLPFFEQFQGGSFRSFPLDSENVRKGLGGSGAAVVPLDRLLIVYLSYFVRNGFIPPPGAAPRKSRPS